jgi:hypothetical protein
MILLKLWTILKFEFLVGSLSFSSRYSSAWIKWALILETLVSVRVARISGWIEKLHKSNKYQEDGLGWVQTMSSRETGVAQISWGINWSVKFKNLMLTSVIVINSWTKNFNGSFGSKYFLSDIRVSSKMIIAFFLPSGQKISSHSSF